MPTSPTAPASTDSLSSASTPELMEAPVPSLSVPSAAEPHEKPEEALSAIASEGTAPWPLHAAGPGAVAGLIGGIPFGIMMAVMGMLPMVAALVGASSPVIGFVVHLGISAVIGAPFGVAAVRWTGSRSGTLALSVGNGLLWWGLGALLLMPLGLGMPEKMLTIGLPQLMSLAGHGIFGVASGLAFHRIWR